MIGWLKGRLLQKKPPRLLVVVQGIGYELEAPMTTFYGLPDTGAEIALHTHLAIRDDAHQLYGFAEERDRNMFRQLLRVNGVGAKVALGILSGLNAEAFRRCVFEGDTATLCKLPGIGKKTAERLVMEMRDRLEATIGEFVPTNGGGATMPSDPVQEAVAALTALGLKPAEASQRVHSVETKDRSCEDIVRLALKSLVK